MVKRIELQRKQKEIRRKNFFTGETMIASKQEQLESLNTVTLWSLELAYRAWSFACMSVRYPGYEL